MKLLLFMENDAQIVCRNFKFGSLTGKNVVRMQGLERLVL